MRKPKRLPFERLEPHLLPRPPLVGPPAPAEPIDWAHLFGNDHPVEIEVGFGKGLFLATAGEQHPDANYLGIEIVNKYVLFTATRLATRGLRNVVVTTADARTFFPQRVAAGSVRTVHVYFPDPWWKNRHHKRIVFTEAFVAEAARVLHPGGRLLLVTDVADYMEMARETVAAVAGLRPSEPPTEQSPGHDMDYLTNFERKFRKEGRPIYRAGWERVG